MTVFTVIKRLLFLVGIAVKDQGQSCEVMKSDEKPPEHEPSRQ